MSHRRPRLDGALRIGASFQGMAEKNEPARTLDGKPHVQSEPWREQREGVGSFPANFERVASGGLTDDPTESGDPVRNRNPIKGG